MKADPEVIKLFHAQLNWAKNIMLININMPPVVGILTFIHMINTASERHKARKFSILVVMNSWKFVLKSVEYEKVITLSKIHSIFLLWSW